MSNRPAIPDPLKRLVRQECKFGCAICGMPIFDYDHIIPYAEVLEHKLENLILLCPNHHRDKGAKLDIELVKEAKKNPFNSKKATVSGYKLEPNRKYNIELGSNKTNKIFHNGNGEYHCLWVNGVSFLKLHSINNWITISMIVTDRNGKVILKINKGEITFSTNIWDYTYVGSNLKIRLGPSKIILDINLSNYELKVSRGCFIHSPYKDGFMVNPNGSLSTLANNVNQNLSVRSSFSENGYGAIGILNATKFPAIKKCNGFGSFTIV